MRNMDCTKPLKMLTVFNNIDAGELTMLDKILGFPMDVVLASTGLDEVCAPFAPFRPNLELLSVVFSEQLSKLSVPLQATINTLNNSLPRAAGDLRVDTACLAACGLTPSSEPVLPPAVAASTAGK